MLLKDMTDEQFRKYLEEKYSGVNFDAVLQIEQADLMRLKAIQAELLEEYERKKENDKTK